MLATITVVAQLSVYQSGNCEDSGLVPGFDSPAVNLGHMVIERIRAQDLFKVFIYL